MSVLKLSQIAAAGSPPALTDQIVGVTTGTTDNLFTLAQISTAVGGAVPAGANTDVQFNNSSVFGGDSHFTYGGAGGTVTVTPALNTNPFVITGGVVNSAASTVLGPKVLGQLNTNNAIDGVALFANITNTVSGAGTLLVDLQVNSSSIFNIDIGGNITIAGAAEISSATSLTLMQTGDAFGPTGFVLQNRFGVNGAIFEQLGSVNVITFTFKINGSGGNNGQQNIIYDRRASQFLTNTESFGIGPSWDGVNDPTLSWLMIGPAQNAFINTKTSGVTAATLRLYTINGTQCLLNFRAPAQNTVIQLETTSANFLTSLNTVFEMQHGSGFVAGNSFKFAVGDTVNYTANKIQFATNSTGGGSALLGANCPAVTVTAPYTWIQAVSSDGSAVFIPAWK